jgi:hypothetical protein
MYIDLRPTHCGKRKHKHDRVLSKCFCKSIKNCGTCQEPDHKHVDFSDTFWYLIYPPWNYIYTYMCIHPVSDWIIAEKICSLVNKMAVGKTSKHKHDRVFFQMFPQEQSSFVEPVGTYLQTYRSQSHFLMSDISRVELYYICARTQYESQSSQKCLQSC